MRKLLSTLVVLSFLVHGNVMVTQSRQQQASAEAERRVEALLKQLTLEEKVDLLGGTDGFFVRGVERLKLPRLKMADGPGGVRNFGPATAMPSGIALAATWNTALAERVGTEIGRDARAKGVHFLLRPRRQHLPRADERAQLRILRRRPVPCRAHRRRLHPRRAVAERLGHHQALHGQQLGVRPPQHGLRDRRARDARNLHARLRGRRARGARRRRHGLLQPRQRRARVAEQAPADRRGEDRVGLRRRDDVRLVRHLRRRGGGQRRAGFGDAGAGAHEPEESAAGHRAGQGLGRDHRRQGAPHPPSGRALRLARPRPDRPLRPALQPAGPARRARSRARGDGAPEERGRAVAAR